VNQSGPSLMAIQREDNLENFWSAAVLAKPYGGILKSQTHRLNCPVNDCKFTEDHS
jgi:hypothetical protein